MASSHFKLIISVVLVGALLLAPLYAARAAGAIMYILKEFGLDIVARFLTRVFLSKMQNGIMGQVLKSGRDGGPAFVQDWRKFLQNAQYRGEDVLRAEVADATLGSNPTVCPYMRSSLAQIFGAQQTVPNFNSSNYRVDSLQPFKLRNRCSLPTGLDVNSFRNDFSNGGWDAWGKLIQPQNNFYGVYNDSLSELYKQRGFEQGIDKSEAESGSGNVSKRANCSGEGPNRQCTVLGVVITPGTIFSDSEKSKINKELDWLIGADELSEVIANFTSVVLSNLANYAANAIVSENPPREDPTYDASSEMNRAEQQEEGIEEYISATPTPTPPPEETIPPETVP